MARYLKLDAMIFRFAIFVICMMLPAVAMANEKHINELRIKVGQSFVSARQHIIADGWHPQKVEQTERIGVERLLDQKGIYETENCSVDGEGYCIFNYQRNNQCLKLYTAGEQLVSMHITGWHLGCDNLDSR